MLEHRLDKFKRELLIGDVCFRIAHNRFHTKIFPVQVEGFTKFKIKVGDGVYVDSCNLIKADSKGLGFDKKE
jgi:hypothetical protein